MVRKDAEGPKGPSDKAISAGMGAKAEALAYLKLVTSQDKASRAKLFINCGGLWFHVSSR